MAKDVITRFKLETTGFDSKIKQAAKELSDYSKTATQAKEGFNQFTKANVDAAKALGTMATSTTNAKDRAKELVGAFNEAAKAYNTLTKEQQQSDWAKALAGSLTQLQQRIKETKAEMQGLGDGMKGGGGLFSGDKLSGMLQVFGGNLMTKGLELATSAVSSLASEVGGMITQGVELAKQGEGIRIAFERLGRGDILDGLREATHGTVTDLELMKAAVKFNDFKLPLDQLGTMLAFAQQKAKDTGQDVNYLVDSIVTGLGRKSLMILDNLGLSATEIRERMKETGDMTKAVGDIIRDQMANAGDYVETAADRAAQANVSLQNKMEELGRKFAPIEEASNQLWTSMKIGILDVVGGPLARLLNGLTEAGRLRNQLNNMNGQEGSGNTKVDQQLKKLNVIRKGGGSNSYFNTTLSGMVEDYNRQIMAIDAKIKDASKLSPGQKGTKFVRDQLQEWNEQMKALQVMRDQLKAGAKEISQPVKSVIDTSGAEQSIDSLKGKLAELEAQRKKAIAAGDTDLSKNLAKQISQVKSDIKGLGGSTTNKTTTKTIKTKEQLNNEEIQKLTQEYIDASDDRRKAIEGEIKGLQDRNAEIRRLMEAAQGKVAPDGSLKALSEELSKLQQERQLLSDPIAIEIQDQAIKDVQDEIDRLNGKKVEVELAVDNRTPFETLKDSLKIEISEENMQVDTTTLQTLMKTAMQNGIDGIDPNFSALQEKMREGMNIPNETWQALQDEINEKLKELGIEPIKIDFKTGKIDESGKTVEKSWQSAARAVQAVGSAMEGIEDPAAKVMGTIAQAIATVALTYAKSLEKTFTPWDWIAAAASGAATMISVISSIHSATGYANGGMVKGNSYSGDNIPALVDGSELVGLNAGEIVLNAAQSSNVAQGLQSSSREVHVTGQISGENIILAANRTFKRKGQGEIVTW